MLRRRRPRRVVLSLWRCCGLRRRLGVLWCRGVVRRARGWSVTSLGWGSKHERALWLLLWRRGLLLLLLLRRLLLWLLRMLKRQRSGAHHVHLLNGPIAVYQLQRHGVGCLRRLLRLQLRLRLWLRLGIGRDGVARRLPADDVVCPPLRRRLHGRLVVLLLSLWKWCVLLRRG